MKAHGFGGRAVARIPLRIGHRLVREATGLVARWVLWSHGVQLGPGAKLYGVPVVSCETGAQIRIGRDVVLCSRSQDTALGVNHPVVLRAMAPGAVIEIGDGTGLSGASICAQVGVHIGQRCLLGADVMVVDTDFHPLAAADRHRGLAAAAHAPVWIGDDVFIGARACVLKGVRIGDGAVVGCAAVVTHDVGPGAVVAGNPARVVGARQGAR